MRITHMVGLGAVVLGLGCSGSILSRPKAAGGSDAGRDPGGTDVTCTVPSSGAAPMRRLTRFEYDNTVLDLLGDNRRIAETSFAGEELSNGFNNNAYALNVSSLLADQLVEGAVNVATRAVTASLSAVVGCDPAATGEAACVTAFLRTFGKRAFRRPVTDAEVTRFTTVFTGARAVSGATFTDAIITTLATMLASPQFLYRLETPTTGAVSGYEMASRLSYFLWGSMPDATLFAAADSDALGTVAQVEAQARRMLGADHAHPMVQSFFGQLLTSGQLASATKDPVAVPAFNDTIRAKMGTELTTFVDQAFFTDGTLSTLLTAPYTFLDPSLAGYYGLPAPSGTGFSKVALDPNRAAGILTNGALMTIFGNPSQSSPTFRGKFIRERFLCQGLPPAPDNVPPLKPVDPNISNRARYAQHSSDPLCSSCHVLMDPLGFGFEHYDTAGKWRDKDRVFAIDTTSQITGAGTADGSYDGAADLGKKLASSDTVQHCMTLNWFRFASGRAEMEGDACSLRVIQDRFAKSGFDQRELLVAITLSDAFRFHPGDAAGASK